MLRSPGSTHNWQGRWVYPSLPWTGIKIPSGYSVVRFFRIDPMVNGSNPPSAKFFLRVKHHQLSVIPGVGMTRCGHSERKGLDTARSAKSLSVSKYLPLIST